MESSAPQSPQSRAQSKLLPLPRFGTIDVVIWADSCLATMKGVDGAELSPRESQLGMLLAASSFSAGTLQSHFVFDMARGGWLDSPHFFDLMRIIEAAAAYRTSGLSSRSRGPSAETNCDRQISPRALADAVRTDQSLSVNAFSSAFTDLGSWSLASSVAVAARADTPLSPMTPLAAGTTKDIGPSSVPAPCLAPKIASPLGSCSFRFASRTSFFKRPSDAGRPPPSTSKRTLRTLRSPIRHNASAAANPTCGVGSSSAVRNLGMAARAFIVPKAVAAA